ncbi:MAG: hypothetical protein GX556_10595 [Fibrobacter sp.]|nr:hypothetical protein [Fibrobacter sp.]
MGCSKWEDLGLLYSSNELDEQEAKSFKDHMGNCEECRCEYETYRKEQSSFFTPEILGEMPSEKIDAEIKRVCSNPKKQYTSIGLLPVFKKTFFSVSFFVLGFIVVGYFTLNIENADKNRQSIVLEKTPDSSSPGSVETMAEGLNVADSLKFDTLNDSNLYYSKNRGNLQIKGVYPVDLK